MVDPAFFAVPEGSLKYRRLLWTGLLLLSATADESASWQ